MNFCPQCDEMLAGRLINIELAHRLTHHDDHWDAFCPLCVAEAYRDCGYGIPFE